MTYQGEPVQLRFDYASLDAETRHFVLERAERIHNLARMTAAGIVQIGQYLMEVKERLKHGQFLPWVDHEFAWAEQAARNFMHVYERFKSTKFGDLQIDISALYLIAAPKTPEPVRDEALRRAANGEPVTHAGTRELVRRFAETGEIPDVKASLTEMVQERRRQLSPSAPPVWTKEDQEREAARDREARRLLEASKINTARIAALMTVIQSIEVIAHAKLTSAAIAKHIERFDTPDQDWHGAVREALSRLRELSKELSL